MIRKSSGGYTVYARSGRKMGTYRTKAEADARRAQLEAFKAMRAPAFSPGHRGRAQRSPMGDSASDEAAKKRLIREGFEAVGYGNYYRRSRPGLTERIIAPWYGGKSGFYAQIESNGSALKGFGTASLAACLKWLRERSCALQANW